MATSKKKDTSNEEQLREIYYDKNINTSSTNRLYQAVKERGVKATIAQVKSFIEKQSAFQTTKTFKKPKEFNSIIAPRPGSNLQIDLMELKSRYKINKTPYLLNVVDINSRKAWSIPLPNKESKNVSKEMGKLIDQINKEQKKLRGVDGKVAIVKSINGDAGGEFESDMFKAMLKSKEQKHGFPITMYTSDPNDFAKNGIVERFNRTFRRLMLVDKAQNNAKQLTRKDVARHVNNYNNDIHSTIKAKPENVWLLKEKNMQKYKFLSFKLKKGDQVRLLNKNALFTKGTYEYSEELYTISKVDKKKYYIVDNNGDDVMTKKKGPKAFQGYELMLVEDVDHSPEYNVEITNANKEQEMQDIEQDKQERAINLDLGKNSGQNMIDKKLRDIEQELEDDEYEIEKIVKRRQLKPKGPYEYLIKYVGYPASKNTWEPRKNVTTSLYTAFDRTLQ